MRHENVIPIKIIVIHRKRVFYLDELFSWDNLLLFNREKIWPSRLVIWFTSPIFVFSLLIFSVWRIVYIQVGLHPLVWIVRWLVPKHYVFVNIGMLYKDIWFTLYSHHHTHWNRLSLLYVIIINFISYT